MALFKVKAVPDFTQLRNELTKLSSTPVKIKVDATDFNALSDQAIKTMNATARLTKAQNELAVAQEKTKQTANQLAAAQQKTTRTANQLATQMERTATAEEKARKANLDLSREIQKATTEQEKQKTAAAQAALQQEKAATASANLAVQQEKTATAAAKAAGNITKVGQSAKETSGFAGMMGDSLANVVGKMAAWQLLGSAISGAVNAFRDALDTMKSVDDEMVTIRKVTGATTEELQKIEAQAYKTASAYGVAADEYLNSVAAFTRAGYGDQASALAELATKTQIVGDTDAKTAQQFLLSVDAAYKYQGSIESLSRVLDGANEIDNKYATSIEKIAEGLGKVAPIASQAHVGVDELTAAIGTITAVTQRSGTEAATALRALFLNIIGDTKTEIDEGVTWTTGEIAGLRDLIKVYAKDAYDLAQATGEVINPMKAIEGLSKSMKDGLLSEQELMEMVSDIGGKLRTSQLLALIQNWDMYQSMLGDYANSIGSADKEVENALDSWSRKTEILRNKWTEFVSHLIETDAIKGALDGVIGLVELLDTDVGRFVVTVGALTSAVILLGEAKKMLAGTEVIKGITNLFSVAGHGVTLIERFGVALAGINPVAAAVTAGIAALGLAIYGVKQYVDEVNKPLSDFNSEIEAASSELQTNRTRLDEINAMPWNARTSEILEEKAALEKQNEELEKNLELLNQEKYERAQSEAENFVFNTGEQTTVSHGGTTSRRMSSTFDVTVGGEKAYAEAAKQLEEYQRQLEQTGQLTDDQRKRFDEVNAAVAEQIEWLQVLIDRGDTLTESQQAMYDAYYALGDAYNVAVNGADALVNAYAELISNTYITEEAYQALIAVYPQLAEAATQTADGYVIQKDALENLMSAEQRQQAEIQNTVSALAAEGQQLGYTSQAFAELVNAQITASNTGLNVSQQIAALQALAVQAGYTAQAIAQVFAYANGAGTYQADSAEIKQRAQELIESGAVSSVSQAFNLAKKQLTEEAWGNLTSNYTPSISVPTVSYPSGGGNSGGGYSGGGSSSRGDGGRQNAQAQIKKLQKERDAELAVIQKQIDALKEQTEEEDRQAKLEEYKLEILKKQDAVMNARNERTVRQYNASTGQWEWVADATKVKKAEEDLENAKKELREYERKVEIDLAVDELKARQEAIKAAYQIKIDAWQDYLNGLSSAISAEKSLLDQSVANNQAATNAIIKAWNEANKAKENGSSSGGDSGDGVQSPGGKDESVYSPSDVSESDIMVMQAYLGTGIDGKWGSKSEAALKNSQFSSFDEAYKHFSFVAYDKAVAAVRDGNSKATQQFKGMQQQGYADIVAYASVARMMGYDEGGILKGMGGIKATPKDEIVLPPKLAAKMLTPLADRTFKARLGELGYLYGAETGLPRTLTGSSDNRSYTDNSGTRYQIGSIVMTEQQAKHTTIYEAAQQAHNLQAFNA